MTDISTRQDIWSRTFFAKLKQYRPIATRYDKLAQNFLSALIRRFI